MFEFDSYNDCKLASLKAYPALGRLVARCYPAYRGRKWKVSRQRAISMYDNYWSGGTKGTYTLVNMDSMEILPIGNSEAPWSALGEDKIKRREIPLNALILKHTIFQGHDLGITFIVHPDSVARFYNLATDESSLGALNA
jgi:hypothetical protein